MPDDEPDEKFNAADAVRPDLGHSLCGAERRFRHGRVLLSGGRSWMAVLVLLPRSKRLTPCHRQGKPDGKPKTTAEHKLLLKAGLVCGTLLF